ncbi:MAG: BTAD domain-containing putative transcriptional regulator [Chloroflexia bacterium]
MADDLRLECLGGLRVTRRDGPVSGLISAKAQALLVYLAVTDQYHAREALAGLLWGEQSDEAARTSLRQAIAHLRRVLGDILISTRAFVGLRSDVPYWVDVVAFEAALRQPESAADLGQLRTAVELYRGDFLAGFAVRDAPAFDEWVVVQQERLKQLAARAWSILANAYAARGDNPAASDALARLLALDPWREEALRQLMLLLARSGQRNAALAQFATTRRQLAAELGVEPEAETSELAERIRAGTFDPAPVAPTPASSPPAPPLVRTLPPSSAPPIPPTPLLGRDAELARIASHLANPACRVLTLTGPGGVGKTRLALEAAAQQRAAYAEIAFVALAPLSDPSLVIATIAQTLGVRENRDQRPIDRLADALRGRRLLLLLDNFEQVVAAAPHLAALLAATHGPTLLVTSQERLQIAGEQILPVAPLSLPAPREAPVAARLRHFAAVRLFVDRAQAVLPDFALTDDNAETVAAICRRLDGLPLAIELAAARVRLLSPAMLLARLETRLTLLTSGARDQPPRHRTLRAALEWSHDLLDTGERQLFRRLAVFSGGGTLEALVQICDAAHDLPLDAIDGVTSLLDKSLIQRDAEASSEPRFTLLETIREYAVERLAESGESDAVHRAHLNYYLTLLEQSPGGGAWVEVGGWRAQIGREQAGSAEWRALVQREQDNFRAALDWTSAHGDAEAGLRLAIGLAPFWWARGSLREGRRWLETMLALPGGAPTALQARGHREIAVFATAQGEFPVAAEHYEASLALTRSLGSPSATADILGSLSWVAIQQDDWARARQLLAEARQLQQSVADTPGLAMTANLLGVVAFQSGDRAEAGDQFETGIALARRSQDRPILASTLNNFSMLLLAEGEIDRASAFLAESVAIRRALDDRVVLTNSLHTSGDVARRQGDYPRALAFLGEALTLRQDQGDRRGIARCLESLAAVALACGDPNLAGRLLGAAATLRAAIGVPGMPSDRADVEATTRGVHAALGQGAAAAHAAGAALPLSSAIAEALAFRLPVEE